MSNHEKYLPNKVDRDRTDLSTERYKPEGHPRPRESHFIPSGVRKDLKINMRNKLS
ncbi:MAG: hypothetical protein M0021_02200 [Clostridia bacterium]|nr:hypothetical protein [Clostridia bacterium]